MCQAKSKGGKRCAAHMAGSTATVSMTTVLTGAVESFVKKVFTGLRKEGKNLQAPSREEVIALADNNAMMSRYDVTIPDNRRASLARRWEEAKNETPDGPTFHAWRHTLAETSRSWRKSFAAVGIAGSLLMTSACGVGANHTDSTPVPSPSVSISQQASPSASAVPTQAAPSVPVKAVVNNGKGEYQQTTISPDDPGMKYNPATADATIKSQYSPEDITSAQQFVVKFIAEEGIDSTLNDGNNVDGWWATNKDKIAPEFQANVKSQLDQGREFVARRSWGASDGASKGLTYSYSKDAPRVTKRSIAIDKIYSVNDADNSLVINTNVDYVVNAKDASGANVPINVKGQMMYAVRKDAATGSWLIDGQKSSYEGFALSR